ncbi:TIR domain-containing protein [Kribbella sp. VKM Ac-2569]|uniref:toll/interleukin-1 receptor domain-containing protein n=1 Tax=Kribbella sp. VKM Ac-2569 TaxID=2512220 RepID=UPI00102B9BB5|nr:TIR domain-containing protein [Kribbella sp. VKM Ac-2569]RZT15199.1 TIR domain-containing protein [Kribbella sp. VKM Ac-2569]
MSESGGQPIYDVCLSFAGEQRDYVADVAASLRERGVRVFYDDYEKATLWGKDLYEHLDWVYRKAARFCILFVSEAYARKVWTTHERRSAQARAMNENAEYVLPVRFDDAEVPGLRETVGYLSGTSLTPDEVAALVVEKLGPRARENYFPPKPDLLFKALELEDPAEQDQAYAVATNFMNTLRRMSEAERRLIAQLFVYGCKSELPENVHDSLDLIRRELEVTPAETLATLRGVRSLGFKAEERSDPDGEGDDLVVVSWDNQVVYEDDAMDDFNMEYSTLVAVEMLTVGSGDRCAQCARNCVEAMDFSNLSSTTS